MVFMDEAGDLNLDLVDKEFPIFALTHLVVDHTAYTRSIVPALLEFKIKYFGHEGVIFGRTYYVSGDRLRAIDFKLTFLQKARNVVGNQMADLICYPIARHVLDPGKRNLPYDVLEPKMYTGPGLIRGLKVFP